jgi:hypothetical protein
LALDILDGSGNHKSLQTTIIGTVEILAVSNADAGTGLTAQVASHTPDNVAIGSTVYSLLMAAIGKLKNAAGLYFDTARVAGSDAIPAIGVPAIGPMLGQPIVATTTSTVALTTGSTTLAMTNTGGFIAGAAVNFEPGTANEEQALITSVTLNTSIGVQFPAGGARFTHTANYSLLTYALYHARQAPGATGVVATSSDGAKPTYRTGEVAQTLYSTTAAVLVEVVGSASKTVRVKKITLWAQAATKFYAELTLLRCTGASAGTPVVPAIGKHDSADGAATAVINNYTAAAAAGAGAVVSGAKVLSTGVPSATLPMIQAVWDFSTNQDKALILRGIGDVVEVFNNTTGLGAGTYGYEVEYEEDQS